eukprot:m.324676 g.324676  ORF g.324676 m.324676 type:complete len:878 (-) comp16544_c0_seq6:89-2722(-)
MSSCTRTVYTVTCTLLLVASVAFGSVCSNISSGNIGFSQIALFKNVSSPAACCALCNSTRLCIAWTIHTSGPFKGSCFLKDNTAGYYNSTQQVFGTIKKKPPVKVACNTEGYTHFPFCNTSLTTEERITDLLSRINDTDKPNLMTARGRGGTNMQAFPSLGVPAYYWGTNCLHSLNGGGCLQDENGSSVYCPTNFPSGPSFSATFDSPLITKMANVIGQEMRASFEHGGILGLDCWGPVINLNRDPRWGRNGEGGTEDAFLMGELAKSWITGFQYGGKSVEEFTGPLQAAITLKHYAANSLENTGNYTRHNFDANVSDFVLADYYLVPFKKAIRDTKAKGVMCSYNAVDGVPTCLSEKLRSARDTWGFDGYVTSDSDSVHDAYNAHHYVATGEEASCLAVKVGACDINSGDTYNDYLLNGIQQGYCTMQDVDDALRRSLRIRFDLGMFDPISSNPWKFDPSIVGQPSSQALSLEASEKSIVLLRNDEQLLPLKKGQNIAVLGPHALAQKVLIQPYPFMPACGPNGLDCLTTPYDAITAANIGGKTTTAPGCDLFFTNTSGFEEALTLGKEADVIVLGLGIETCGMNPAHNPHPNGKCYQEKSSDNYIFPDQYLELEAHDRTIIDLPPIQHQFAKAVLDLGKPVVLFLMNGGSVAFEEEKNNPAKMAIIEAFYPGPHGGVALAKSLFGDANKFGRLPYTIYPSNFTSEALMSEHDLRVAPGRTYRYYNGEPLYPFGAGMSLTTFTSTINASSTVLQTSSSSNITLNVGIKNSGSITGDVVALAFFSPVSQSIQFTTHVKKQLFEFTRIEDVAAGSEVQVQFSVSPVSLGLVRDPDGDLCGVPGQYRVCVEVASDTDPACITVTMEGSLTVLEPFPGKN